MEIKLERADTGAPVDMTEGGRRIIESRTLGGSMGIELLKKGQSLQRGVPLEEFYAPPPGRYKFTAKLSLHPEGDHEDIPVVVGPMDLIIAR
jgi:hypothetical protein